jgi:hypothetical protein
VIKSIILSVLEENTYFAGGLQLRASVFPLLLPLAATTRSLALSNRWRPEDPAISNGLQLRARYFRYATARS